MSSRILVRAESTTFAGAAGLLALLAACGSSGPPGEGTSAYTCMGGPADAGGSRVSVSVSSACPSGDITGGKGTKLEDEPCARSEECKQICCSCSPQSSRAAAVVMCSGGKCATKEQVCCSFAGSTSCEPR